MFFFKGYPFLKAEKTWLVNISMLLLKAFFIGIPMLFIKGILSFLKGFSIE